MGSSEELVGCKIESWQLMGCEYDAQNRWVGADVFFVVPPGGYIVNVVTREQYAQEILQEILKEVFESGEGLRPEAFREDRKSTLNTLNKKEPYVVNYPELDLEVLRELLGGVVTRDLVDSMWYDGPYEG